MSECPNCGDTERGFYFTETTRTDYAGKWGEEAEHYDGVEMLSRSLVECRACKTKFRYQALVDKGIIAG